MVKLLITRHRITKKRFTSWLISSSSRSKAKLSSTTGISSGSATSGSGSSADGFIYRRGAGSTAVICLPDLQAISDIANTIKKNNNLMGSD
jgi:hypothetical protein